MNTDMILESVLTKYMKILCQDTVPNRSQSEHKIKSIDVRDCKGIPILISTGISMSCF